MGTSRFTVFPAPRGRWREAPDGDVAVHGLPRPAGKVARSAGWGRELKNDLNPTSPPPAAPGTSPRVGRTLAQVALAFQVKDDLLGRLGRRHRGSVDDQVGVGRLFVWV
jgi:hypothetical protein